MIVPHCPNSNSNFQVYCFLLDSFFLLKEKTDMAPLDLRPLFPMANTIKIITRRVPMIFSHQTNQSYSQFPFPLLYVISFSFSSSHAWFPPSPYYNLTHFSSSFGVCNFVPLQKWRFPIPSSPTRIFLSCSCFLQLFQQLIFIHRPF